jgi:hypothetical protein
MSHRVDSGENEYHCGPKALIVDSDVDITPNAIVDGVGYWISGWSFHGRAKWQLTI